MVTVEMVARTAVIFVLVSAITASGLAPRLVNALWEIIACATELRECDVGSTPAVAEHVADPGPVPCTRSSNERISTTSTDIILTRKTSGSRYLVRERSDGVVEILETTSRGEGGVVAGGARFGKGRGKLGLGGAASLVRVEEEGDIYVLETAEEKAGYERARDQEAVEAYMHPTGEWQRPGEYALKRAYLMSQFRTGSYRRVSDNASVDLSGGIKIVQGNAGIAGETGTVVERNDETGEETVSFDVKGSATGELGVLFLGGSAATDGLISVSLTTSSDGTPTSLVLSTETEVSAGADITFDPSSVVDLPSFVKAASGWKATEGGGLVVRVTAGIELDDTESQAAALDFAENPGIESGGALLARFDDSGQGLVEVLRSSTSTDGFGAGIALLGSLGFADERSARALAAQEAWGWRPIVGLTRRTDCAP